MRLVGVDTYIYTNIWERIASTEERKNWQDDRERIGEYSREESIEESTSKKKTTM
jgi:hypothetical protein